MDWSDGHILAQIKGKNVWNVFKDEVGQHSCQRVPITEHKGRKQTSMVSVAILPIKDDVWEPLKPEDIDIKFQCGSGPGGQHINKSATTVRMTHKPSGLSVLIIGRSQKQNKEDAEKLLTAKVRDQIEAKNNKDYSSFRKDALGDGRRGSKIRTYNFLESRIKDHRTGKIVHKLDKIFKKGQFDLLK